MTELDVRRPFSRADALAAGLDAAVFRGPLVQRLFRGVYLSADVPVTPHLRAQGAVVPFPDGAFASHASAARVHAVPIPTLAEEYVTVTDPDHRRSRDAIRCLVRTSDDGVVHRGGLRVSGHARMFIELAELIGLVDLVIVGDVLAGRGTVTPARLAAACRASDLPGAARARTAAALVRTGVDSPMETRLRLLIALAGLPEPEVNHEVRDETGHVTRRYDLYYRRSRTLVEYEGRHHAESTSQWNSDIERREELDDQARRLVVVTGDGIFVEPERTLHRIHRILMERGEPGVPKVLSNAWRLHFPGRRRIGA
ncbi:MAG TPA: hypothetical protein VNS46_05195 [Nocardioides sp.]|nr:hypothetical protein [Nocardioides sp.]